MSPEAEQILHVFRRRKHRSGDLVHYTEFGDAIVWENGCIRDEPVRDAIHFLAQNEYVVEMPIGLQLLPKGELHVRKSG